MKRNLKWVGVDTLCSTDTLLCGVVAPGAAAGGNFPDRNSDPDLRVHISARLEAFRQRLRELGYVQGKNILIEYRYAEGKLERLPALAAELVRSQS